ncbi:hypothetical protein WG66_005783 [Moniliophthora roreri]|nr:hypothetical protein WG66_005783 [Moniliophthora roreri]
MVLPIGIFVHPVPKNDPKTSLAKHKGDLRSRLGQISLRA